VESFAILVTGGLVSLYACWQIARSLLATGWPTTTGTITDTRNVHHKGSEGLSGEYVRYRYVVNDQPFVGDRVRFGPQIGPTSLRPAPVGDSASTESVGRFHRLSPGTSVRVHYNPRDPSDSVLLLAPSPVVWFVLAAGLLFAYLGAREAGFLASAP
jgi:hypothetical protein